MNKETLKGYILEEALTYLIRTAGYKLLTDKKQDPDNLQGGQAGLEVRGRGGWHQADVLGQLEMIPAFSYPFRLFLEAKHRGSKVDMPVIRSAIGIVTDVNQAPLTISSSVNLPYSQAYHYVYSVFSASGFEQAAIRMATSYLISLVDLSMEGYRKLLDDIDKTAEQVIDQFTDTQGLVKDVRHVMRTLLNTYSADIRIEPPNHRAGRYYQKLEEVFSELVKTVRSYDRLYVGTVNAPFILVLKASNPDKFENYALNHKDSTHNVTIHWTDSVDNGRTWFIRPAYADIDEAYELSFRLPDALSEWIFKIEKDKQDKAMQVKSIYFSSICVYVRGKGLDQVVKLSFDAKATLESLED